MELHALKSVNICLNANINSFLETSGGQSSILYLKLMFIFLTPVLLRHLWHIKTVAFPVLCLIRNDNLIDISTYYTIIPLDIKWSLHSTKSHSKLGF